MNRTPVEIDIREWEKFGGGFVADSFYKKDDDTVMMKLCTENIPPHVPYQELCVSENVAKLGLPTAKAIEYIKTGNRYGAVFERIQGKRSIARILGDEPERADEMGKLFAGLLKRLHTTECDTEVFFDLQSACLKKVQQCAFLSDTQKDNAIGILSNLPKKTTCLHGDCHLGNVILASGREPMFIDLGDFSYGNPLFDLGTSYFMAECIPDGMCLNLYHIHLDVMHEFWESFVKNYFPGESLEEVNEKCRPFAGFQAVHFSSLNGKSDDILDYVFTKAFGK